MTETTSAARTSLPMVARIEPGYDHDDAARGQPARSSRLLRNAIAWDVGD